MHRVTVAAALLAASMMVQHPANARELTKAEKVAIAAVVTDELKDPESARFKWSPLYQTKDDRVVYCAYVNAKNSYGGSQASPHFVTWE